ncbi:hypothetical protein AN958_05849 [Leucoagaricus sp. SymC.cos]|nr:hypothetical protein AN958_05849 [Leucoagaricus sp. SymC.cos]
MFSPPPSPRPPFQNQTPVIQASSSPPIPSSQSKSDAMPSYDQKRQTGRQFRWALVIVPLVLILITASTQYLTHPAAFDVFSTSSPREWSQLLAQSKDWRLHRRHPSPEPDNGNSTPPPTLTVASTSNNAPAPSPSQATVAPQSVPAIPSAPPTLPTPFPQPYDPQLTLNFSSVSCLSFFTNMTQSTAFRPCRPFSLLSQSSAGFIDAQTNLTLMNTLIWGTCNTNLGINQCIANMGWFASTLKTACEDDLKDQNSLAVNTLIALNAYKLMYDVACSSDPTSNTYCYINAVANTSPADLFLYQLPLGISVPSDTSNFSCSPCSRTLLGTYADALSNKTLEEDLTSLKQSYESSVQVVGTTCGADFARSGITNSAFASSLSCVLLFAVGIVSSTWLLVL